MEQNLVPIRIKITGKIRQEAGCQYYDAEITDVETGRTISNITSIEFLGPITGNTFNIPQVRITILRPDIDVEFQTQLPHTDHNLLDMGHHRCTCPACAANQGESTSSQD